MHNVEIYYFSATGNSLAVARDVADKLDARLIPVMSVLDQDSIATQADVVGLVFPIYDFKPAPAIERFVGKLRDVDAKYLFAVCTYGIAPSQSLKNLNKLVASRGGHLAGGFAVGMPHSGIGSGAVTQAQQEEMFRAWQKRLTAVADYVDNRSQGTIESSRLALNLFQARFARLLPAMFKFVKHALLKGTDSLAFTPSGACNSCGICARICPSNNIDMVDGRPVWSDDCLNCFACLNWCPQEAISLGGADMDIRNYHHPEVKISNMLRQRQDAKKTEASTPAGDSTQRS